MSRWIIGNRAWPEEIRLYRRRLQNLTHHPMDNVRMVRVGNRIVNLMQITFAEYSPAFTPPPLDANVSKTSKHHPISYARPEPKPSSLIVHFFGGEHHQFFGELADELNEHFDLYI